LGRFRPNSLRAPRPPSSPHGPFPPRPLSRCQPGPTRKLLSPLLSCDLSVPGKWAPLVSAFLAPVTELATRSPPATARPVASPLLRSPARFGALRLPEPSRRPVYLSHPVAPSARAIPSSPLCAIIPVVQARQCSPPLAPFPAPGAYKRTTQAPSFSTPASATPSSLPRAQLSQHRRALPPLW
jgi:hypothetical protein